MADEDADEEKFELLQHRVTRAKELLSRTYKLREKAIGTSKLIKKIQAELRFLESLTEGSTTFEESHVKSSNLLHLESVLRTVEESSNVVGLFKPVITSNQSDVFGAPLVVDVVANGGALWFKVVARNALALHRIWEGDGQHGEKGIVEQAREYLKSSKDHPVNFSPPHVTFAFFSGVTESMAKALIELGVSVKGDVLPDPGSTDCSFNCRNIDVTAVQGHSPQQICKRINLDVTTMIAFVSALTNGSCKLIFQEQILTDQAEQERTNPLLPKLHDLFQDKELFSCRTAVKDFNAILDTIGGENEKQRARELLKRVQVVDDEPSVRAQGLLPSSRVRQRSKIIFGTGDTLKAITVTANASFVRAAANQGVEFSVCIHDSRALTEAKEQFAAPSSETVDCAYQEGIG